MRPRTTMVETKPIKLRTNVQVCSKAWERAVIKKIFWTEFNNSTPKMAVFQTFV
jgi:hypothetical protein